MGCCGQNRAIRGKPSQPAMAPAVSHPASNGRQLPSSGRQTHWPTASAHWLVSVRYLERSPILVRGPATGQQYQFSGTQAVQSVDARDAEALLKTRFFRRWRPIE